MLTINYDSSTAASQIRGAIDTFTKANDVQQQRLKLPPHLRTILKSSIPRLDCSNSVAFIASNQWFGSAHERLADIIQQQCFHQDAQSRKMVGIVQAYGCGKTKTALKLTEKFIVLPMPKDPSLDEVSEFSQQCLHLVHLYMWSLVQLFEFCVANELVDPDNAQSRFTFALLLLTGNRALIDWCVWFFTEHQEAVLSNFYQFQHEVMNVKSGRQFVFIFDEVHNLFGKCHGYYLFNGGLESDKDLLQKWKSAQRDGQMNGEFCTDLYYQLRTVMAEYLQSPLTPFAFVTCSTKMSTWQMYGVQEQSLPVCRDMIVKFTDLHQFTKDEVLIAISSMFDISGSILSSLDHLEDLQRPYFVCEFLNNLCTSFPRIGPGQDLKQWLNDSLEHTRVTIKQHCLKKVRQLCIRNRAGDVWTLRELVYRLFTALMVCGGTLVLSDEMELSRVSSVGVAQLEFGNRVRIVDHFYAEAIRLSVGYDVNQCEAVMKCLTLLHDQSADLESSDHQSMKLSMQRALAWLFLSGQISFNFNPYFDDDAEEALTIRAFARSAGTSEELQLGSGEAYDAEAVIRVLESTLQHILLPCTPAGPDLVMRATVNGVDSVILVHSKVDDNVCSQAEFIKVLNQLDLSRAYSYLEQNQTELQQALINSPLYMVVFNALGFSGEVQYAVKEHNQAAKAYGRNDRVLLLNLDDLRCHLYDFYSVIRRQVVGCEVEKWYANEDFISNEAWKTMNRREKMKMKMDQLFQHSSYRGMKAGKTKDSIIQHIGDYCNGKKARPFL
ncbi:hypothetical protein MP228_008599 [Amoeboaphelidium protococcarum]|nr:hypothetical protein MP228_008599 [Amoeboaphelidium protococcarum]